MPSSPRFFLGAPRSWGLESAAVKRLIPLLLLACVARAQEPEVIAPKENYFGAMPKLYARLIKVDPRARTVEALFEPDNKPATLPLAWDAELYRNGAFAAPEDFRGGMRVFVLLDTDARKRWAGVRALMDEATAEAIHDRQPVPEAERQRQAARQLQRWNEDGLPARLADVDAVKGRAVMVVAREGSGWARTLKRKDAVRLQPKEGRAFAATVVECWPDAQRTKLKIVAEGRFLSTLSAGQDMWLRMKPPEKTSSLDALGGQSVSERIARILSTVYCTCGIMAEQCAGKFFTLEACNAHGCPMYPSMKRELAEWMQAGMTDEQIIQKLVKRDGEKVLKPHLD